MREICEDCNKDHADLGWAEIADCYYTKAEKLEVERDAAHEQLKNIEATITKAIKANVSVCAGIVRHFGVTPQESFTFAEVEAILAAAAYDIEIGT